MVVAGVVQYGVACAGARCLLTLSISIAGSVFNLKLILLSKREPRVLKKDGQTIFMSRGADFQARSMNEPVESAG